MTTRNNPNIEMEPWKPAIVDAGPEHIRVRGVDVLGVTARTGEE